MRKLFELDLKDYKDTDKIINRIASKAIFYEKPFLYMITSNKYHDLKFVGGGQETGETLIETLKREVLEEAGLTITDKIKPFGYCIEKRKSIFDSNEVFMMTSYYYVCEIKNKSEYRNFDQYEKDYEYELIKIDIDDAIDQCEKLIKMNTKDFNWIYRELKILKLIKDEL